MLGTALTVIPMLLLAGYAIYRVVRRGLEFRQLVEDGVDASATVVSRRLFRNGSGNRAATLRYRYQDALGRSHEYNSMVSRSIWEAHPEGSAFEIVYSRSRPALSAPRALVEPARKAMNPRGNAG
jgi:hypothetical protein